MPQSAALRLLACCLPLFIPGVMFGSQNVPLPSPLPALEELADKTCQPQPGQGVPPKARVCLEQFKDRLGPWIREKLASLGGGSTAELGQRLSKELDSEATRTSSLESFWHPLRFQVEAPEPHPELLTVTARFGIDATLLLFRRGESGWKLIWQDRAPVYKDIDGAYGDYTAVMTPKGADDSFFLAAARITPWYQSWWRMAELRVFQIGAEGGVRKIGQKDESVYLGNDHPLSLSTPDARHLHFQVCAGSSDLARHNFLRTFLLRLDVAGLRRVPPFAETPLDLVDEWLSLPWKEAAILSEASTHKRLKPLHERLSNHKENLLSFDEEPPKQDPTSGIWEVRADLERDEKSESYVFRVGKIGADLRLLDIQRSKP